MNTPRTDVFIRGINLITKSGAILSADEQYRYLLWRTWDEGKARLLYIMLNPSTADARQDDATIRVCVGRAKQMGYGGILVANLFALRATHPNVLYKVGDPMGPENNAYLAKATWHIQNRDVIYAWGKYGTHKDRGTEVLAKLKEWGCTTWALKINQDGTPAYPLRIPYSQPLVRL